MYDKNRRKGALAIDIGSCGIKVIEVQRIENNKLSVVQCINQEYSYTTQKSSLTERVFDTLSFIFQEYNFQTRECYLCVSLDEVYVRFVRLPPVKLDNDHILKIIKYEALQYIPYDINNVILDYQLIEKEQNRLDVMFVVARNDFIQKLVDILKNFNCKVDCIDVSSCAIYNVLKANAIGKEECIMYISLGGNETSCVFVSGKSFFSRTVNLSGNDLTKAISVRAGVSFRKAESLKKRYCSLSDGTGDKEIDAVIRKEIKDFVDKVVVEARRSINQYRAERGGDKCQRIYLGGGSSVLPYLVDSLSNKLRVPVDYLNAFQCFNIDKRIDRNQLAQTAHLMSEVLGVVLRGFYDCAVEIHLRSKKLIAERRMRSKIGYFIMLYIVLLIYPIVSYLSADFAIEYYSHKIRNNEQKINKKNVIYNKIFSSERQRGAIEKNLQNITSLIKHRTDWIKIFKIIEKNRPLGVLFSSIVPIKDSGSIAVPAKVNKGISGVDMNFAEQIKWQRENKKQEKHTIDRFLIKGYAIYNVPISDVKQSLPEQFLQRLKAYDLEFIMFEEKLSYVKNEVILDEAQNITYFELSITLFKGVINK